MQDSTLPYLGNNYKLKIIRKNDYENKNNYKDEFLFIDGIFIVKLNRKKDLKNNNEINRIKSLYESWLKQKCISIY